MKTIIGKLLKEQLGSGYNCEADSTSPSGFACVPNQIGAGQFIDLATCLASGCEDVQGGCCDDCADFPNNFVPNSHYPSPLRFCAGCTIAAGTSVTGLPPNQMIGLPMNIPYHTTQTTANADGQGYCCDCCNSAGLIHPPATSIPNAVMDPCGNVVNGEYPTDEPKCAHGECYYCPGSGKECKAVGPFLNQALDSQINLYTDKFDCETSEADCLVNAPVDTEKCHCCTPNKKYGPGPVVMPGNYAVGNCEAIHSIGASLNPTSWISKEWFNCRPVSEPLACPGKKFPTKDFPKEPENPTLGYKLKPKDVGGEREIREESKRFKELISEQLGSGFNCEADPTTPSGFACTQNQFGAGQFPTLAACQAAGCETTGVCPSGHPFHGWPSGYPTNNDFTWSGPPINFNFGGVSISYATGSLIPATYANWFNAGQSSYCEWCGDYAQGNAGGGSVNSQGFDARTDVWVGGGYGPEACACCPGTNAMAGPLAAQSRDSFTCSTGCRPGVELDFNNDERVYSTEDECKRACSDTDDRGSDCCDWCVSSRGFGRPPRGCFDFDCDRCEDFDGQSRERLDEDISNIRFLHKKYSKVKGNG